MKTSTSISFTHNLLKSLQGSVSIYAALGVNMVTGFALSVMLVRGLSQEAYGSYRLISSILLAGSYACSLGLESTLLRFASEFITTAQWTHLRKLVRWIMGIRGAAILLFCAVLLGFRAQLASLFHFSSQLRQALPLIAVIFAFHSLNNLWGTTLLSARLERVADSVNKILVSVLKIAGFSLALWLGFGLNGIVRVWAGLLCGSTLYYTWLNLRWFRRLHTTSKQEPPHKAGTSYLSRIKRFTFFHFFALNLLIFSDISIDNFVIAHYLDSTQVALYGLASTLVLFVVQLNPASVLRGVLNPLFVSRYTATGDQSELLRGNTCLFKIVLFCTLPAFTMVLTLGDKIIAIVYSPDYAAAYLPLLYLCTFFFFIGLIHPIGILINTLEKNELLLTSGIFSVYNLIMDIVLVPRYGIVGAAIATGSAGFLQFFFYLAAFRWYVKLRLIFPWKALGQVLLNTLPVLLLTLLLKPYISNIAWLLFTGLLAGGLYAALSYWNFIFDQDEIHLFKRALGNKRRATAA